MVPVDRCRRIRRNSRELRIDRGLARSPGARPDPAAATALQGAVPPLIWPVAALVAWTLVSVAASDAPADALPQVKKFFVFAILPLAYTAFRSADACRRAAEAWVTVVLGACLVALVQFARAVARAGALDSGFYSLYVDDRVTGFYSHWMTFSQASVLVLLTLACYLLFAERRRGSGIWIGAAGVIATVLLLSFTRSAWLALLAGGIYLLAMKRPKTLFAVPVLLAAGYIVAPEALQQRVRSIRPGANQARIVMWRTGLNMIADHPLLGVGPERAGPLFAEYQPSDIRGAAPGLLRASAQCLRPLRRRARHPGSPNRDLVARTGPDRHASRIALAPRPSGRPAVPVAFGSLRHAGCCDSQLLRCIARRQRGIGSVPGAYSRRLPRYAGPKRHKINSVTTKDR